MPLISIIIPVFNGERYLSEAINSVLNQQVAEIELIVVDDGSSDGTAEIVRRHLQMTNQELGTIRYIRQANAGPASARNHGIQASTGDLLAFLDADDIWPPGRLAAMQAEFALNPELILVMGKSILFKDPAAGAASEHPGEDMMYRHPQYTPVFGSILVKRSAFQSVGLINEHLLFSEDQDWFLRAREHRLSTRLLANLVLKRRRHKTNMTAKRDWRTVGIFEVLHASIQRRRAHGQGVAENLPSFSDLNDSVHSSKN